MRAPGVAGTAVLVLAATVLPGCWIRDVGDTDQDRDTPPAITVQVREMLADAAAAWNRGDLESFMGDYERSPRTTYIGGGGRLVGFDAIRTRFAPAFRPGAERDSLRFEDLQVRALGQRYALATARYVLHRGGEVTSSGPFTLVLLSVEGRWKIIHDHTSTDTATASEGG